jgi:hypothetical protein
VGPIAPKLGDCRSRGAVHAPTEQIDLEQAGASSERRSCFFLDLPTAIMYWHSNAGNAILRTM